MSDQEPVDAIQDAMETPGPDQAGEEQPAAKARLRLMRGTTPSDETFDIADGNVVGRFDPNMAPVDVDLGQLSESGVISRRHAKIRCEDGRWFIEDTGSSNGTFKQGADGTRTKLEAETEIFNGDIVVFGNVPFVVELENGNAPQAAPVDEPSDALSEDEATRGLG